MFVSRSPFVGRRATVTAASAALVLTLLSPVGAFGGEPADGVNGSTLVREPLVSPQELGADTQTDLMYADPTEQLSLVAPPDPDSSGAAAVDYPIVLPKGRGMTPELAISYTSGGPSSWAGLGWDLSVGDVSVDTEFGVPLFCPRDVGPKCDDVESESYTLDGEALLPSAVRSSYLPRIADREDFTGRMETQYRRIIRHGDNTKDYFWEVVDKEGAIKWYGAYPDSGGPFGEGGKRPEPFRNDKAQDTSAILFDDDDNAVRWYLSAERDVGVNFFRYEYDTITYRASQQGQGTTWVALPNDDCPDTTVCARHVYLVQDPLHRCGRAGHHAGRGPGVRDQLHPPRHSAHRRGAGRHRGVPRPRPRAAQGHRGPLRRHRRADHPLPPAVRDRPVRQVPADRGDPERVHRRWEGRLRGPRPGGVPHVHLLRRHRDGQWVQDGPVGHPGRQPEQEPAGQPGQRARHVRSERRRRPGLHRLQLGRARQERLVRGLDHARGCDD